MFGDRYTRRSIEVLDHGDASSSMRVRHDDAGVDRESLASHLIASCSAHHRLEQSSSRREIPLSRKCRQFFENVRMVRNAAVESQPAKRER